MPTTKTYAALSTIPTGNGVGQTSITKCAEVLENRQQCWRAGDFLITRSVVTPATDDTPEKVEITKYQKCRRHAQIEQDADTKETANTETFGTAQTETFGTVTS